MLGKQPNAMSNSEQIHKQCCCVQVHYDNNHTVWKRMSVGWAYTQAH